MTHICFSEPTSIGSDNGLSPGRRQAIIWTNAGILLIGPLGTNLSDILIQIQTFSFKKMHLKISSAKWRQFCLGLNVLKVFPGIRRRSLIKSKCRLSPDHHDDVIKWKHFPRNWPFVRGIHRSPVNSPHKGQWRGALIFPLICVWINGWVNNRKAGDLRRYCTHYDVIVMYTANAIVASNDNHCFVKGSTNCHSGASLIDIS